MAKQITTEEFIPRAKQVHGALYDYDSTIFRGMTKSISFLCKGCGWISTISQARKHGESGTGCQVCGGYSPRKQNTELFLKEQHCKEDRPAGCPSCGSRGFDKNTPTSIYLAQYFWQSDHFYKIGVTTGKISSRLSNQSSKTNYSYTLLKSILLPTGREALDLETKILQNIDRCVVDKDVFPDGYTETFNEKDLAYVLSELENIRGI